MNYRVSLCSLPTKELVSPPILLVFSSLLGDALFAVGLSFVESRQHHVTTPPWLCAVAFRCCMGHALAVRDNPPPLPLACAGQPPPTPGVQPCMPLLAQCTTKRCLPHPPRPCSHTTLPPPVQDARPRAGVWAHASPAGRRAGGTSTWIARRTDLTLAWVPSCTHTHGHSLTRPSPAHTQSGPRLRGPCARTRTAGPGGSPWAWPAT
jgi:hypothetical protein